MSVVKAALNGITVLALEQAVAVPFATRQLADLGARVIKVERPVEGDFARHYDTRVKGLSSYFAWLNRSKESLALDLKSAEAQTVVRQLASSTDVVVQNLSPGATTRLGLSSHELRELNPRLITVDLTGYGNGGPLEDRKAYDLLIQAEAGLLSVTGSAS
ncbi:MAG: CoA transferase, partial [Ilumatobacteraceae bacterium]